jgi:methionyl-tRNA formyltransferase
MSSVLLFGMGPTAVTAFESLAAQFRVIGVIRDAAGEAQPDADVEHRATELGVPVLRARPTELEDVITKAKPDCVVVSSYHRILPERVIRASKFINVHYSPLPRYRGRANVNWAIINGEREAAITIHSIVPGLDAGTILYQETTEIGPHDTVGDIYSRLNEIQREKLGDTVARHLNGYEGTPQDESQATYGCARIPADGEIDWSQPTEKIYALVRALSPPYPGAYTYLGTRRITITRARPVDAPRYVGRVPGRVVARSKDDAFVDVLSGDGVLRIFDVIAAGGPVTPAPSIITSTRQTLGLRTADLLIRIEELEKRLDNLHASTPGPAE